MPIPSYWHHVAVMHIILILNTVADHRRHELMSGVDMATSLPKAVRTDTIGISLVA